jgi:undecaprenyl-diphosphatase
LNLLQAIILGILQGITEFFPISSSAHLKWGRYLLGLPDGEQWLSFDLACHAGTWLALVYFLRKDVWQVLRSIRQIALFTLALVPLVPAYFLLKPLRLALSAPQYTGYCLLFTALLLLLASRKPNPATSPLSWQRSLPPAAERGEGKLKRSGPNERDIPCERKASEEDRFIEAAASPAFLSMKNVLCVGIAQALALIPGISRSGATIATGRFCGWNWTSAARFSFLLAVPTILGGEMLESLKGNHSMDVPICLTGLLASLLVGLVSVRFMFWFYERGIVKPFVWYCTVFGLLYLWTFHG